MSELEQLATRLQVLEDIEAIKKVKAEYCAHCDNGPNAQGIGALFAEDGVWDGGVDVFGRYEGRAAIEQMFAGASKVQPFSVHNVMNPIIEVNGDEATGQWYLFQPCTLTGEHGDQAVWGAATYVDDYKRINGVCKIQTLRVIVKFWTPYDQGWVEKRLIQDAP